MKIEDMKMKAIRRIKVLLDSELKRKSLFTALLSSFIVSSQINAHAQTFGVDVSSVQGQINWDQVSRAGKVFAFVKATEGEGFSSPDFETRIQGAKSAGLLAGVYHLARPSLNNAVNEAQYFVRIAGDYLGPGYLRPALDLEDTSYVAGETALAAWVEAWISEVRRQKGVEPIIYSYPDYIRNYLDASLTKYDLWIANYPIPDVGAYDPNRTPSTPLWNRWSLWQYSEKGQVDGISVPVDLDVFNGDRTALNQFLIADAPDSSRPTPPRELTAMAVDCADITLTWNVPSVSGHSGLGGYKVFRGNTQIARLGPGTTSLLDTARTGNTEYCYTVVAFENNGHDSDPSDQACAKTPSCPSASPTVSIAEPADRASFQASPVTVRGQATDDWQVEEVQVRLNNGDWIVANASELNGIFSWNLSVQLASGSNKIEARSKDRDGNYSTMTAVSVNYTPSASESSAQQRTFNYTGSPQSYIVPSGVTSIRVDVRGAQGGSSSVGAEAANQYIGGKGGRVQTTLTATPGETLWIYVGGAGGVRISPNTPGNGGWNGGGAGGIDDFDQNGPGNGGGGASDIRRGGNGLANRVVVAGGGGGSECCGDGAGGNGGGMAGASGISFRTECMHADPGSGGTQSAGGSGGASLDIFGGWLERSRRHAGPGWHGWKREPCGRRRGRGLFWWRRRRGWLPGIRRGRWVELFLWHRHGSHPRLSEWRWADYSDFTANRESSASGSSTRGHDTGGYDGTQSIDPFVR